MARINSYTRTTSPADNDVFILDSTSGSAGTRTILWSAIKTALTSIFAPTSHTHPGSDITSAVSNATNATQDSSGQNIISTYIKSITVSGRTLTITKGNNASSTLTTQDTTYSAATTSRAGLMSAADKSRLDSLVESAGTISAITTAKIDSFFP